MSKATPKPQPDGQQDRDRGEALPIGQHEGEGTNAVTTHKPDPRAEPIADGERPFIPRTGYNHGND